KEERAKEEIKEETQSKLINKNIIFFAYDESLGIRQEDDGVKLKTIKGKTRKISIDNAYVNYAMRDYETWSNRQITMERVTSIELKIIKTRFRLEFDGQSLQFLENERLIKQWEARSGEPLDNLKEDSKENKQRKRFALPFSKEKSFYYDENLHKQDSTKPLKEGIYYFKVENAVSLLDYYILNKNNDDVSRYKISLYNDENMIDINTTGTAYSIHAGKEFGDTKGIDLAHNAKDFFKNLKQYIKNTKIAIPLKVKYQKRIFILIERFKESTEATMARMNVYVDGKRVNNKGKFIEKLSTQGIKEYELFNPLSLPNDDKNYAYILERPGPDSIGGELKLRIPEGSYDLMWNDGGMKGVLKLFNSYVSKGRAILIHAGNTAKNSDGCLLINDKKGGDNIIIRGKEKEKKELRFKQNLEYWLEKIYNKFINKATLIIIKNHFTINYIKEDNNKAHKPYTIENAKESLQVIYERYGKNMAY
ncbi:DUF5675 family protein, partial [Campylobacter troglodytis]|uniref:DUF5675 family protein n=1 Tax=Campylobacter troglodytis TaxID=654363 RepID=UPI001C8E7B60